MKDGFAGDQKVVSDDPAMAPPPDRFRTHDGAALCLIRIPGDHFGLAIFGHQWKPAWLLIFSRSPARAAHRVAMISSRAARVGMCLLTTGSSTSVHNVSVGCTSGV